MGNELERFIEEGVFKYAEACEAVDLFRAEVWKKIHQVIVTYEGKALFKGSSGAKPKPGSGSSPSPWVDYLYDVQVGRDAGKLELGFWWNCSFAPDRPEAIAYTSFYSGSEKLTGRIPKTSGRVDSFLIDGRSHAFVALKPGDDLVELLSSTLEALLSGAPPASS